MRPALLVSNGESTGPRARPRRTSPSALSGWSLPAYRYSPTLAPAPAGRRAGGPASSGRQVSRLGTRPVGPEYGRNGWTETSGGVPGEQGRPRAGGQQRQRRHGRRGQRHDAAGPPHGRHRARRRRTGRPPAHTGRGAVRELRPAGCGLRSGRFRPDRVAVEDTLADGIAFAAPSHGHRIPQAVRAAHGTVVPSPTTSPRKTRSEAHRLS
jgi:hypothetical protein